MFRTQNIIKRYFIWIGIMLLSSYANAQTTLYSVGTTSASSPATSANWSLTSGGTSAGINPSNTYTLVFDGNSQKCFLSGAGSYNKIILAAGFNDTVTVLSSSSNLVIATTVEVHSGCLKFNDNQLYINSGLTIDQGASFIASKGITKVATTFNNQGVFYHNDGTFITNNNTAIKGTNTFNNVLLNIGTITFDSNSTTTINGNLTISDGGTLSFNGVNAEILLHGNLNHNNKNLSLTSSVKLRFVGAGDQIFTGNHSLTGGTLPALYIDKPSGTLFLKDTIGGIVNPVRLIQGTLDASTYQSTVSFTGAFNAKDNITFHHVVIPSPNLGITVDTNRVLGIKGDLSLNYNSVGTTVINGPGEIQLYGNLYNNNYYSSYNLGTGGTGKIRFVGSSNQIWKGNSNTITGTLPTILIDKPSGQLILKENVATLKNPVRLLQGIVDASTYQSTVGVAATVNFKENIAFNNIVIHPNGVLNIDSNVVVGAEGNFSVISNTNGLILGGLGEVQLKGNYLTDDRTGVANTNTGTLRFVGTGDQILRGNHSLNTGALPAIFIDKSGGTLFFKDTIGRVVKPIRLLQGTLDATTYQSTVIVVGAFTVKENMTFHNFFVYYPNLGLSVDSNVVLTVNGELTLYSQGGGNNINGPGEIHLKGNLNAHNQYPGTGGNGTIRFNGTTDQILKGNHHLSGGTLPKLYIDKPSGTLFFKDSIGGIKNPIRLFQGTVDASTYQSTACFTSSFTLKESIPFHHVIVLPTNSALNIDSPAVMQINGNLTILKNSGWTLSINGPGEIQLKGDLNNGGIGSGTGGNGTIRFTGTTDQILKGNNNLLTGSLPQLIIDKPTGTLFFKDTIGGVKNPIRLLHGTLDASTYQSTTSFFGSFTMKESYALHHVIINPGNTSFNVDTDNVLQVNGNLTLTSATGWTQVVNGPGEVHLNGDLFNNSVSTLANGGNGTIRFTGTQDQVFKGNHLLNGGTLPSLVIDKPSGTLFFKDTIGGVKNPIRLIQGTVDPSTFASTVSFTGPMTFKDNVPFHNVVLYNPNNAFNIDSGVKLPVYGLFRILYAPAGPNINGLGEIALHGDLYNDNYYWSLNSFPSGGTGTIRFVGQGDQVLKGSANTIPGTLPSLIIDKPSGTLFLKESVGTLMNPFRLLSGNLDATTFGSSVGIRGSLNLKENLTFDNLKFIPSGSNITIDTNVVLTVNNKFTIGDPGTGTSLSINWLGSVQAKGNLEIFSNFSIIGNGSLIFSGTGTQLVPSTNAGEGKLPNVIIRKPSGIVSFVKNTSLAGNFTVEKGTGTFADSTGTLYLYGTNSTISNESDSGYVQIPNVKLLANSQLSGKLHVTKQVDLGTYTLALNNFGVQNDNPDSTTSLKYTTTGGFVTSGSLSGSYSQKCLLNKNYKIPFRKTDNTTITPVSFRLDTATTTDSTNFTISTYGTDPSASPNNRPLPFGLEAILDSNGHDASGFVLDRYWNCKVRNTASFTSAQLKVSFLTSEYGSPNTISSLTNLKAYGYSGVNEIENIGILGSVSASSTTLKLRTAVTDGITLSTLPINRGGGMGNAWDEIVCSSNALLCVKIAVTPGAKGSGQSTLLADIKRGQGPFTYLWSNGATSSTIENVNAGDYAVTVTDAIGNQVTVQQFGGQQMSLDTAISVLDSLNGLTAISPDSFVVDSGGNNFKVYGLAYGENRLGADGSGIVSFEWEKGSDFTGALGMIHDLNFDYGYGMMLLPMDSPTNSGSQRLVVAGDEQTMLGIVEDTKPLRLDIVQDATSIKYYKNKVLVYTITKSQLQQNDGVLLDVAPVILFFRPLSKLKGWMTNFGLKADPFDEAYKSSGKVPTDVTYYIDDHLGNLRVSYKPELTCSATPNTPPTVNYNLEGVYDYSAYGRITRSYTHNTDRYLSTQHERDAETGGLEGYDYRGARLYDSDNGRFMSVDPKQQKYANLSPYVYCADNAVAFVDPDGKDYALYIDHDSKTITVVATYYTTSGDAVSNSSAQSAVQQWNEQSGKFLYTAGKGEDAVNYVVNFELNVVETENPVTEANKDRNGDSKSLTPDKNSNVYKVLPDSHFDETTNGQTTGGVLIEVKNSRKDTETGPHEVGHTLNLKHSFSGLMTSESSDPKRSKEIKASYIDRIIKKALKGNGAAKTSICVEGSSNVNLKKGKSSKKE